QHRELPPTLHFASPNPRARLDGAPFSVTNRLQPWTAPGLLRAGVTGLGAGGTNAHVVLEEAPPAEPLPPPKRSRQLLVLSARTPGAADHAVKNLAAHLTDSPALALADVASTLQRGRKAFRHRRAVVASSIPEAIEALRTRGKVLAAEALEVSGLAFLYPGGGAQYAGMGAGLYASEPVYRRAIDECVAVANLPGLRESLTQVNQSPLEAPSLALPALFATEVALTRLFASLGVVPSAVIGHSAGEYAAAVAAGVMDLADAMALVSLRGRLFERLPAGGMVVVPLSEEELTPLLPIGVSIAAVNGPKSCVASGPLPKLEVLESFLRARDLEYSRVHINVAAHSAMVDAILPEFEAQCRRTRFSPPKLAFISNVTGARVQPHEVTDPQYWVRHLRQPVRFFEGIRAITDEPGRLLLEVGPGRTLSSLARQAGAGEAEQSLRHPQDAQDDAAVLLHTLGRLFCRGLTLDWDALDDTPRARVPLPTYPFEGKRHWVEPQEQAQPAASMGKRAAIDDWFAAPAWLPAAPPIPETSRAGPWLLFDAGDALGDAVAHALLGSLVVRVRPGKRFQKNTDGYLARAGDRDDLDALFTDLRSRGLEPQHVLHLTGASVTERGAAGFEAVFRHYEGLVFLAQQLAVSAIPARLVIATSGATGVSEVPAAPEQALLFGPARVISRELPHVSSVAVDLGELPRKPPALASLADALLAEALGGDRARVIALRHGRRFIEAIAPLHLPQPARAASWAKDGTRILITGGLGGLGLTVAQHAARNAKVKLALLGRNAPDVHQRDQVRALEALGAEVLTLQADVSDKASLRAAIAQARQRFGGIDVVLHAAGTLRDLPLAARGADTGRPALATKALGALLLDELLADAPPALFVSFSSVSALLGLPGQIDYTAANACLDALAQAHSGGRTRAVSINWNAWQEVGLAVKSLKTRAAPRVLDSPVLPIVGQRLPNAAGFQLAITRESHWVVGEHVVRGGEAVLPGTGVLELFTAAVGWPHAADALELRDVAFVTPLVVPKGETTYATLSTRGSELTLHQGDPDAPNATASGAHIAQPPPRTHDLAAIRARCTLGKLGKAGRLEQPFMDFGPRWSCLAGVALGRDEALVELSLPQEFTSDLKDHPLHPALLDLAAGSAQALAMGFVQDKDFFVPLSWRRLVLRAPLPAHFSRHVKLHPRAPGAELVFDLALIDAQGHELAFAEGYALRRVSEGAFSRTLPRPLRKQSAQELALREGILPAEGMAALDRVLASPGLPQVVASSVDLETWRRSTDEAALPKKLQAAELAPRAASYRAPRTDTEKELAALWSELLGLDRPGLDDNFFDQGGESLIAVRLSVRLRRKLGVELPIATLFEVPTLEAAARWLDNARGIVPPSTDANGVHTDQPNGAASAPTPSAPRFKHLVCIERGQDLAPFFCVHGAGGNVLNFRDLARGLDRRQPFWGIAASGNDGRTRPAATVEEAAEAYLAEVRAVVPHGPYLLGGYSGGGVIAYEMAQHLLAAGERVGLLAFIDTYSPFLEMKAPKLGRRLQRLRSDRLAYLKAVLAQRGEERERRQRLVQVDALLAQDAEIPPELREPHLFRAFSQAIERYVPKPSATLSAVLFRVSDVWFDDQSEDYGWGRVMPGRVHVVRLPGNHQDLLLEPNASALIRTLHHEIEAARLSPPQPVLAAPRSLC
ncbi:MAG: SDR family NAD(P)-dependent oxidoreductase, partial [Deltaproteobacteria bacterium]|nr:SDR family NAD(P)-dependent oxidoreductase [Deltaproteobacteria bacterium]